MEMEEEEEDDDDKGGGKAGYMEAELPSKPKALKKINGVHASDGV
jgi:hypothetical protein